MVSRDIIILTGIGVLKFNDKPLEIRPEYASKIATFFQLATICFFLGMHYFDTVKWLGTYLLYITAFFTVYSGLHYIRIGLKILHEEQETT